MREAESSKLLIPWIIEICDSELYLDLLRWIDKSRKIFFLSWIHKSSANWNATKSDVFKKWAEYKSKLGEKDDRDVKAAFRNALRSKKNCLRLVEKGKEHRHWQILSEPIKIPKRKMTNNTKKPRQKRGTKKVSKKCQPESETNSLEPPPSSGCNSVFNDGLRFLPSPLPPYQSLFHASDSPAPLQKTEVTFTDLEEQSCFDCLISPAQMAESAPLYGIPSPNVHSSPHSPAQMSMSETLYGIQSPNVHSSPHSPAQMSMSEPLYGISSPNVHSSPHSPAQISMSETLYGIPSSIVYSGPPSPEQTSNSFSSDETQQSACNSPTSFSNALSSLWMSPEQEVPSWDMANNWIAVSEMEKSQLQNQAQGLLQQIGGQLYPTRDEELVPSASQDYLESLIKIELAEPSSLSPEHVSSQEDSEKSLFYDDYFNYVLRIDPERQLFEQLVDFDSQIEHIRRHQL